LLVEDDPGVRALARASLEYCGYTVHVAESAGAAPQVWDTLNPPAELLLTDWSCRAACPGATWPSGSRLGNEALSDCRSGDDCPRRVDER
jgi:CheY-like chemotaxis protein